MTKEKAEILKIQTKYIIEQFYKQSLDELLSNLHPQVVWIGAAEGQYIREFQPLASYLSQIVTACKCTLTSQTYEVAFFNSATCIITGLYYTQAIYNDRVPHHEIQVLSQRITVVWVRENRRWEILHIHVSNPIEMQKPNKFLPNKTVRRTYEHVQKLLHNHNKAQPNLTFRGKNSEYYYVKPEEILYVEADNIYCQLHCSDRKLFVCQPMNQLTHVLPKYFIRVHRSFIINGLRTAGLSRYTVCLEDGSCLPVPEKKYSEIQALLQKLQNL